MASLRWLPLIPALLLCPHRQRSHRFPLQWLAIFWWLLVILWSGLSILLSDSLSGGLLLSLDLIVVLLPPLVMAWLHDPHRRSPVSVSPLLLVLSLSLHIFLWMLLVVPCTSQTSLFFDVPVPTRATLALNVIAPVVTAGLCLNAFLSFRVSTLSTLHFPLVRLLVGPLIFVLLGSDLVGSSNSFVLCQPNPTRLSSLADRSTWDTADMIYRAFNLCALAALCALWLGVQPTPRKRNVEHPLALTPETPNAIHETPSIDIPQRLYSPDVVIPNHLLKDEVESSDRPATIEDYPGLVTTSTVSDGESLTTLTSSQISQRHSGTNLSSLSKTCLLCKSSLLFEPHPLLSLLYLCSDSILLLLMSLSTLLRNDFIKSSHIVLVLLLLVGALVMGIAGFTIILTQAANKEQITTRLVGLLLCYAFALVSLSALFWIGSPLLSTELKIRHVYWFILFTIALTMLAITPLIISEWRMLLKRQPSDEPGLLHREGSAKESDGASRHEGVSSEHQHRNHEGDVLLQAFVENNPTNKDSSKLPDNQDKHLEGEQHDDDKTSEEISPGGGSRDLVSPLQAESTPDNTHQGMSASWFSTHQGFVIENGEMASSFDIKSSIVEDKLPEEDSFEEENDDEGYYCPGGYHQTLPHDVMDDRYVALCKLGWGEFSTVWLARDRTEIDPDVPGAFKALKISKSAQVYHEAALVERSIMESVGVLHESFVLEGAHGSHVVLVTDVAGPHLLHIMEGHNFKGLGLDVVQVLVREVLRELQRLHDGLRLVHTDIKPENILLRKPATETMRAMISEGCSLYGPDAIRQREEMISGRTSTPLNIQECFAAVVADFGAARSRAGGNQSIGLLLESGKDQVTLYQTQEYRAPEVLFGYADSCLSPAMDIWSLGCVAYELLTGSFLFEPKAWEGRPLFENQEAPRFDINSFHITLIQQLLGPLPNSMVKRGYKTFNYFTQDTQRGIVFKGVVLPRSSVWNRLVNKFPDSEADPQLKFFADFLMQTLILRPSHRPSASELLTHPFVRRFE